MKSQDQHFLDASWLFLQQVHSTNEIEMNVVHKPLERIETILQLRLWIILDGEDGTF